MLTTYLINTCMYMKIEKSWIQTPHPLLALQEKNSVKDIIWMKIMVKIISNLAKVLSVAFPISSPKTLKKKFFPFSILISAWFPIKKETFPFPNNNNENCNNRKKSCLYDIYE